MENETLRQFNGDVNTKEMVRAFMLDFIDKTALERMYKGEDVSHIKDAVKLIDGAFDELNHIYGIKTKPQPITNQAK